MADEQPRKKIRLTGPDDSAAVSQSEFDSVAAQLEQEKKAGISIFASEATGFGGVVKKRYTDFLVNEISTTGTVFHLDELTGPAVKAVKKVEKEAEAEEKEKAPKAPEAAKTENGAATSDAPKQDNAELDVKERINAAIASVCLPWFSNCSVLTAIRLRLRT